MKEWIYLSLAAGLLAAGCGNGGGGVPKPENGTCPDGYFFVDPVSSEQEDICVKMPEGVDLPVDGQDEAEAIAEAASRATGFDCDWNSVSDVGDVWRLRRGVNPYGDVVYGECEFSIEKQTGKTYCRWLG